MPYFGPYFANKFFSIYWRPIAAAAVRMIRRALIRRAENRPDPGEATVD